MQEAYINNPELLETKRLFLWEYLEKRIKEFNLDHLSTQAFERLQKMWDVSVSYWVHFDTEDIESMLNQCFIEYQKNNPE